MAVVGDGLASIAYFSSKLWHCIHSVCLDIRIAGVSWEIGEAEATEELDEVPAQNCANPHVPAFEESSGEALDNATSHVR